ncbi:uncharacterized protein LOC121401187 [Xenopus laevis]|uniref:Uncharacterized protein LOC121401187 n=1 Tax=Xenopus laevis TaxID=8355 RepID=A0A8J1MJ93_XENLA|nr:uncharacterized protein LOC121401187 [Xenopus laevis]
MLQVWLLLLMRGSVTSLSVSQDPPTLNVTEGGNFQLFCSFGKRNPPPTAVTFTWSWNHITVYEFVSHRPQENVSHLGDPRVQIQSNRSGSSSLYIRDVVTTDSALYLCKVTIHSPLPIINRQGKGTRVIVTAQQRRSVQTTPHDNKTNLPSPLPTVSCYEANRRCQTPFSLLPISFCTLLFVVFVVLVSCICIGCRLYYQYKIIPQSTDSM